VNLKVEGETSRIGNPMASRREESQSLTVSLRKNAVANAALKS